MEAGLTDGQLIEVFAMVAVANMMTVAAIAGFALLFREDRAARAEGRKFRAPGYAYALALIPVALAVSSLVYVS